MEAADIGTARLRRGMTQLLGEEVAVRAGDGDGGAEAVVEAVLGMVGDRLRTLAEAKASLSRRLTESTLAATVGQSELAELKEAHRREKATELRAVQEAAQRAEVRSQQTQKRSPGTPDTAGLSAAAGVVSQAQGRKAVSLQQELRECELEEAEDAERKMSQLREELDTMAALFREQNVGSVAAAVAWEATQQQKEDEQVQQLAQQMGPGQEQVLDGAIRQWRTTSEWSDGTQAELAPRAVH